MNAVSFPSLSPPAWPVRLARAGLWVIGAGFAVAVLAGPLHRVGLIDYRPALVTLGVGLVMLITGALSAISGLLGATRHRIPVTRGPAVLGIVVALLVIGYLLSWIGHARAAPPIHDISTDLDSPPEFVAVRDIRLRTAGVHPPEYLRQVRGAGGTIDVPAQQRRHYPDIRPLMLAMSPGQAFEHARRAAEALGWEIVAAAPREGRIEATDRTPFFGFRDDVVIRVRAVEGGARVDVRSKSRVGLGDVGANAARIREFAALLQAE